MILPRASSRPAVSSRSGGEAIPSSLAPGGRVSRDEDGVLVAAEDPE